VAGSFARPPSTSHNRRCTIAQFTLNIPNGAPSQRVLDAFTAQYGYQSTIDGAANPETPQAFVKRMLTQHMKDVVKSYEASQAAEAARQAAIDKAETEITIT
jgi:hypothetical protein